MLFISSADVDAPRNDATVPGCEGCICFDELHRTLEALQTMINADFPVGSLNSQTCLGCRSLLLPERVEFLLLQQSHFEGLGVAICSVQSLRRLEWIYSRTSRLLYHFDMLSFNSQK